MNIQDPTLSARTGSIDMAHGGGGRATAELIADLFQHHLTNPILDQGNDAALLPPVAGRLVMSTDGHVISPIFFPGGDIGSLAVHGTLNDVAMAGAEPLYLTVGFILEEGFPLADLEKIVISMARAAEAAGVPIVTGDTKVVEKGKGDGVFITTTGLGVVPDGVHVSVERAEPGQAILLSGSLGDHGVAILSKRENLEFETEIRSDSAALHTLVAGMISAAPGIAVLRDPTRGGLAATLNEIARTAKVGIHLEENAIPIKADVKAACELLGLDPLYVANEGKMVCLCEPGDADAVLAAMRAHPLGRDAALIGTVTEDDAHLVEMETEIGGVRVVDWLAGEQLPRIC
ncbi:hydrogenase expression/formation protein HypE [Roseibium alexandrii]|uniref:Hydrogenase expression/formation protein HypE n=1 Tax=Roseibium alexandrii (strain DSM 17067 / NCIMB 14079 / DFL-11) TaxID=244592 RepID=A0A5E8H2D9_ROSAD|nr:hydrogenase expression/formation protein HypE [Roseibium alexandrii]EEE46230.1 hydrogenase expression/formation protein HypE [Roseibium alexandrii DFL-11]